MGKRKLNINAMPTRIIIEKLRVIKQNVDVDFGSIQDSSVGTVRSEATHRSGASFGIDGS